MSTRQVVLERAVAREQVEDFLYFEAELLDQWRLEEWETLLTDDAVYQIPSNDCPESNPRTSLFIIADDRARIHQRVLRILSPNCHAEYPRSRTQRMISNVRISKRDDALLNVSANFVCYRFRRGQRSYTYVGSLRYVLKSMDGTLRIKERRVQLASEELGSLGSVSFIL